MDVSHPAVAMAGPRWAGHCHAPHHNSSLPGGSRLAAEAEAPSLTLSPLSAHLRRSHCGYRSSRGTAGCSEAESAPFPSLQATLHLYSVAAPQPPATPSPASIVLEGSVATLLLCCGEALACV